METTDHQEAKPHRCKVCGKDFPCGRSLGGHMRSHISLSSPPRQIGEKPQIRKGLIASATGYGLRENPKRTWRISEQGVEMHENNVCNKCGKVFASQSSLFGHMKCHAERSHGKIVQEEVEDMEQEQGVEDEDDGFFLESQSDNEVMVPRKRRRSRRVLSIPCSSSPPRKFNKEQEDVAVSLMMLSKGIEFCCSFSSVAESDDRNMVDSECEGMDEQEEELIISRNVSQRNGLKKMESDVSDAEFDEDDDLKMRKSYICDSDDFKYSDEASMNCYKRLKCSEDQSQWSVGKHSLSKKGILEAYDAKSSTKSVEIDLQKVPKNKNKSRYKCLICNKSFHSYQALGGHRSSHMRMRVCLESGTDGSTCKNNHYKQTKQIDEKNADGNVSMGTGSEVSKKVKEYKCPICCKVFSSGQALGGHKRSHFLTSSSYEGFSACQRSMVIHQQPPTMPHMLDLNLPASIDENSKIVSGSIKVNSWWAKSNAEHEPLVSLISN